MLIYVMMHYIAKHSISSHSIMAFREGDLRVIRPFVYVREKDLRTFAEKVKNGWVSMHKCE